MDRDALRAAQAPLKDRYRDDPAAALTRLHAEGDYRDEHITCTVSMDLDVGAVHITAEASMARLARSTERYCVVGQSLKHPPVIVVRRRDAS